MKPFRQHVALSMDGGGIRGAMVAKALALVEEELGQQSGDLFHLAAGTSTGSIIAGAVAARIPAGRIHELYDGDVGPTEIYPAQDPGPGPKPEARWSLGGKQKRGGRYPLFA